MKNPNKITNHKKKLTTKTKMRVLSPNKNRKGRNRMNIEGRKLLRIWGIMRNRKRRNKMRGRREMFIIINNLKKKRKDNRIQPTKNIEILLEDMMIMSLRKSLRMKTDTMISIMIKNHPKSIRCWMMTMKISIIVSKSHITTIKTILDMIWVPNADLLIDLNLWRMIKKSLINLGKKALKEAKDWSIAGIPMENNMRTPLKMMTIEKDLQLSNQEKIYTNLPINKLNRAHTIINRKGERNLNTQITVIGSMRIMKATEKGIIWIINPTIRYCRMVESMKDLGQKIMSHTLRTPGTLLSGIPPKKEKESSMITSEANTSNDLSCLQFNWITKMTVIFLLILFIYFNNKCCTETPRKTNLLLIGTLPRISLLKTGNSGKQSTSTNAIHQ